jgi:hypothetical protein
VIDEPAIDREILDASSADNADAVLLSEEEEDILESFDVPGESFDSPEDLEPLSSTDGFDANLDLPEEPSESFDLEPLEEEELLSSPEPIRRELDSGVIEDTVIDVALDDLDYEESAPGAGQALSPAPEKASSDGSSYSTTEINIEDFGFSDESSAPGIPSLEDIGTIDALSESSPPPDQSAAPSDDFESLDIDLQFDDTIPSVDTLESADAFGAHDNAELDAASGFESIDLDSIGLDAPESPAAASPAAPVPEPLSPAAADQEISLDSFIDNDDEASAGIIPDLEIESVALNDEPIGFDDVKAVSDDLSARSPDPSSDMLQKIALELSSIKDELVSLRSQLSSLKASGAVVPEAERESGDEVQEEGIPGGFFDDEDDDTIALTGDELDNILNTADFTEEAADDEALEEFVPREQLEISDDIELLPEDGDYQAAAEPGIGTIDLPTVEQTDDEIQALSAQEGVTPITSLVEDTSFLDAAAEEELVELDGMPLEDMPLIEPDASDLDIIIESAFGNEEEEIPALESGEDLEELEPEIVLDIDSDAPPVVSTVDTFPEPLEEIEDAEELEEFLEPEDLGGMELHSEEMDLGELEELSLDDEPTLGTLEEMDSLEPVEDDQSGSSVPLTYHPDELATSLDDSLFVESAEPESLSVEETDIEEALPELEEELDEVETIEEAPAPEEAELPELEEPSDLEAESFEDSDVSAPEPEPSPATVAVPAPPAASAPSPAPDKLKSDVKSVLLYLDQLLASLPEEKIEEFASSEYYDTYKRLFDDLGLL